MKEEKCGGNNSIVFHFFYYLSIHALMCFMYLWRLFKNRKTFKKLYRLLKNENLYNLETYSETSGKSKIDHHQLKT